MVDFVRGVKRCGLWAGMGIGKSSALLYVIDTLKLLGELSTPALVIGPARVAADTWPEEVAKWDQFRDLTIVPLTGGPRARLDKLKARADIFTVSYELAPWLVEYFMAKWPYRGLVVADEADRLKGLRGKKGGHNLDGSKKRGASGERAFQLARIAHSMVDRWVNLTGTPTGNQGYADLWGQTWYLDRGQRLGATHGEFMRRYFQKNWSGYGVQLGPYSKALIDNELRDICLTIDPKDYFDLREPIVNTVNVTLPPKARALYKDLETKMFAEIAEYGEVRIFNKGGLVNKCLQVASGAVYTESPTWAPVHNAKIEALESIVHEAGGAPLLVQYNFRHEAARIQHAFPRAIDLSTDTGLAIFKDGGAPMGYAHAKSMGHGIDGLQKVCNTIVRFGQDWNTRDRDQMRARIGPMRQYQEALDRPVFEYDIIAKDTVDEDVIEVHKTNCSVLESLMNAMKRRHA
jgi:SNF2 family DNA or RNA helicase